MNYTERFEWVDYAKAIGICLVVYGHVARGLVSAGLMTNSTSHQYIDSVIYSFHMPLFFFLSGLFLISSFQSKGLNRALGSKVDTIIYPYILWSLLQGGVEVGLSSYTNGDVSLADVLSLFTEPRAQFWFLYALFLIFLVSFLALLITGQRALSFLFFVSVIIYLLQPNIEAPINIGFITNNLIFFLLGAVFQELKLIRFNNGFVLLILLGSTVIGQLLFHKAGLTYIDKGVYLLVLSVISLVTIVSFSEWMSRFNLPFLAYVGVSSMAIYLMHILAGSGSRVILSKMLGIESVAVHLSAGTLLGIFLPLIALKIINKFGIPHLFYFPMSRYWLDKNSK